MRQNVPTKEASVCAWLGIDHMALTRVGSGRMIGDDDDFIPHHMYQLEVSCCSLLIQVFPPLSINQGSIHKVSQAPEALGDYVCEDAFHLTQHSPLLANQPLSRMQCEARCWSHFGSELSLQYPEFTPPGLSLCWCAILQRWLSVRAVIFLYISVCLSGWLGTVQVDVKSSACIYPPLQLWMSSYHTTCDKSFDV